MPEKSERSDDIKFFDHDVLTRLIHEMGYKGKYASYRKGPFLLKKVSIRKKIGIEGPVSYIESAEEKTEVEKPRRQSDAQRREMSVLRHRRIMAGRAPSVAPADAFQGGCGLSTGGSLQPRPSAQELDWAARQRHADYTRHQSLTAELRGEPGAEWGMG